MTEPRNAQQTEEPYGPEALAIMARARRRAGISVLIMLIGFMAIAGVIVYRLSAMSSSADARYAVESVAVPAGAEVLAAEAREGLVSVTYRVEGQVAIRLYDAKSGELIREIAVVAE